MPSHVLSCARRSALVLRLCSAGSDTASEADPDGRLPDGTRVYGRNNSILYLSCFSLGYSSDLLLKSPKFRELPIMRQWDSNNISMLLIPRSIHLVTVRAGAATRRFFLCTRGN